MKKVILIKYGELTTKKGNRNLFINTLYQNIKRKLKNYEVNITKEISRMYIEFNENDLELILSKLKNIFGLHTFHVANKVSTNEQDIKNTIINMLKQEKIKTFKVKTKRSDKNFNISSVDFSKMIGSFILNNFKKLKVDVHNPELLLNIEIRQYYSYIYTNSYRGLGGYPVGTLGRGLVMLSGGIDSPVAFYLAAKRGIKLDAVYFESMPYTSLEARNKVINLCKILTNYTDNINLYIIPFTEIQEAIYKYTDNTYAITIMRRMMYRIMEKLVKKMNYQTIINGESIGQVASQTLTSLLVVNEVTNFPIIRPLACLDKLEIINISKRIGTYETSILPYEDCCTIFVPKHPVINPKLTKSKIMEEKFDYEKMINQAIEKLIIVKVNSEKIKNELL